MNKFVITIARETGSGGHNITKKLSEALGVPYYDRDLLRKASEVSGIHERLFGEADERIGFKEMISAAEKVYTGEVLPPAEIYRRDPRDKRTTSACVYGLGLRIRSGRDMLAVSCFMRAEISAEASGRSLNSLLSFSISAFFSRAILRRVS